VRAYLESEGMLVDEAPEDEGDQAPRQSYNFAPGYYGIVYRADTPDWGAGPRHHKKGEEVPEEEPEVADEKVRYKLQSMKWGLIPFFTKRNPDYASMMKTINCRDDSLSENRGMWITMKQRKRCIVIAQGFYEWLKKNGGKDKIPHYVKRKDGQLMCFAGLWDCVQYEGSDEKLYTYTIITTSSNKQLSFLHDRMPVILENGTEDIRTWLDPRRHTWSRELQSLLTPFKGELEIYQVTKDVGKVGNNSPTFIVPISSSQNKNNIANFFANAKDSKSIGESTATQKGDSHIEKEPKEERKTIDHSGTEDNAPLPVPEDMPQHGLKRGHIDDVAADEPPAKAVRASQTVSARLQSPKSSKKTRSATRNDTKSPAKSESKDKGSHKITNFFSK